MRFKIFNTKIYVSFLFLAFLAVFLIIDKSGFALPMILASLCHEFGHLFSMWIFNAAPKEVNLIPGSIQIVSSFTTIKNNIFISLSGPITNLIIFFTLFLNNKLFETDDFLIFALINLILGLFNLLPIRGLDGGSVVYNIILFYTNEQKSEIVVNAISVVSAVLIMGIALILTFIGQTSISAYLLALYLILSVLLKF